MKQIIFIFVVIFMLAGCKSKETIVMVTDTLRTTSYLRDSIYVQDSVYVKEYMCGDTVKVEKMKYCTIFKERMVHDTCYVAKHDMVRVTVKPSANAKGTVTKLSWWKRLMADFASYIIGLLLLLLLLIWLKNRITNHVTTDKK